MYIYCIKQSDKWTPLVDCIILVHTKKYSDKEFNEIVCEAENQFQDWYVELKDIGIYLCNIYGFKFAEMTNAMLKVV